MDMSLIAVRASVVPLWSPRQRLPPTKMTQQHVAIMATATVLLGTITFFAAAPAVPAVQRALLAAIVSLMCIGIPATFVSLGASARRRWNAGMQVLASRLGSRHRGSDPAEPHTLQPLVASLDGFPVQVFAEYDEGTYQTQVDVQLPGVAPDVLAAVKRARLPSVSVVAAGRTAPATATSVEPVEAALRALAGLRGVGVELDHCRLHISVSTRKLWRDLETEPARLFQIIESAVDVARPLARLWAERAAARSHGGHSRPAR